VPHAFKRGGRTALSGRVDALVCPPPLTPQAQRSAKGRGTCLGMAPLRARRRATISEAEWAKAAAGLCLTSRRKVRTGQGTVVANGHRE